MSAEHTGWSKRCACGMVWSRHAWVNLPFVGRYDDGVEAIELRNCAVCWSTIAVPTHTLDHVAH